MLIHALDAPLHEIQQCSTLPLRFILISISHDCREYRSVHVEGETSLQQLFQRKRKLIQEFIAKQMSVLLVDNTKIFDVDKKNLEWFLKNHPEFETEDITKFLPAEWTVETAEKGYITLLPHKTGTDGFFISRMRRKD